MHSGHRSRQSSIVAGVIFVGAGIAHFARPDFFESIVPDWFPDATLANRASGAAELTFGLGMLHRRTRKLSAQLHTERTTLARDMLEPRSR